MDINIDKFNYIMGVYLSGNLIIEHINNLNKLEDTLLFSKNKQESPIFSSS